jgi:mRNA interferase YafQ
MFKLKYSNRFKKDIKRFQHDKTFLAELEKVLDALVQGKKLPLKNFNHRLSGEFKDCYECHVSADTLIIYRYENKELIILLLRLGSHSELF